MEKNPDPDPGSGINFFLLVKILKFFDVDPDPVYGSLCPGWKNSDPDPQTLAAR
jgi:hypothetical protein